MSMWEPDSIVSALSHSAAKPTHGSAGRNPAADFVNAADNEVPFVVVDGQL